MALEAAAGMGPHGSVIPAPSATPWAGYIDAGPTTPPATPEGTAPAVLPWPSGSLEPEVIATPAPAPKPKTLLNLQGKGIKTTKPFASDGSPFDVAYAFDCSYEGPVDNFIIFVNGSDGTQDVAANVAATSGHDDSMFYPTGPGLFHLAIDSACTWHVVVTG